MQSPNIGPARAVQDDGFTDLELDPYHQNMRTVSLGDHSLPNPEEVRISETHGHRRKTLLYAILAGVCLLLVIIIPVSIASSRKNTSSRGRTQALSQQSSRFQETMAYLSDYVDNDSLADNHSPQFRAAEWMADDDPLQLPLEKDGHFLQRYALVVFYYATQGEAEWTHQLKFLTDHHECDWNRNFTFDDGSSELFGVRCDDDKVVDQLVIGKYGYCTCS